MKPIAIYALSNHGGVTIYDVDCDLITAKYYDNDIETVEIQYDSEGEAFFVLGELKIPLNECMLIDR